MCPKQSAHSCHISESNYRLDFIRTSRVAQGVNSSTIAPIVVDLKVKIWHLLLCHCQRKAIPFRKYSGIYELDTSHGITASSIDKVETCQSTCSGYQILQELLPTAKRTLIQCTFGAQLHIHGLKLKIIEKIKNH